MVEASRATLVRAASYSRPVWEASAPARSAAFFASSRETSSPRYSLDSFSERALSLAYSFFRSLGSWGSPAALPDTGGSAAERPAARAIAVRRRAAVRPREGRAVLPSGSRAATDLS